MELRMFYKKTLDFLTILSFNNHLVDDFNSTRMNNYLWIKRVLDVVEIFSIKSPEFTATRQVVDLLKQFLQNNRKRICDHPLKWWDFKAIVVRMINWNLNLTREKRNLLIATFLSLISSLLYCQNYTPTCIVHVNYILTNFKRNNSRWCEETAEETLKFCAKQGPIKMKLNYSNLGMMEHRYSF